MHSMIQQQRNQARIADLRDQYAPMVVLTKDNARLFDEIGAAFANAVAASESSWLAGADRLHGRLLENFDRMERHDLVVDRSETDEARQSLAIYMDTSREFAARVITDADALISGGALIDRIESNRSQTAALFAAMEQDVQRRFENRLDSASQSLYRLQLQAIGFAIMLIAVLVLTTVWISVTTKRQFAEVVERMKDIATGSTDFSRRLERRERDELSYLIYWINRLTDKFEESHLALAEISITDKLTQLNNRRRADQFFPERIAAARLSGQPFAVVMLDIDHFKSINDRFGHQTGDQVLQGVADVLKKAARENDFIARWGGEEFILLLSSDNRAEATRQADRVRRDIEAQDFGEVGQVTASFGLTLFESDDSQDSMVKRADAKLYEAKSSGRNRVAVD